MQDLEASQREYVFFLHDYSYAHVAMALAFVLQRTLVRANIIERYLTVSILVLILSLLYLLRRAITILSAASLLYIVLAISWGDSAEAYLLESTLEGQWDRFAWNLCGQCV